MSIPHAPVVSFAPHALSTHSIRRLFLEFFESKGHKIMPSSSILPIGDQSLLFTNSGMVQFKDIFTGREKADFKRAATSQKCLRAGGKHNDLGNVGYTARHHTFFEMLGNFSFGDYFKKEAIEFAFEFLTVVLQIPPEKLVVTVYHSDQESADLWSKIAKFSPDKIIKISTADNFWSMGDSGPCGPCSEIFYDYGPDFKGNLPGGTDEGERYIEIWNLVFMQFEQMPGGELRPLAQKSVDTGMGLERIAAVCQNVHDNYKTDLFANLISVIAQKTGCSIDTGAMNQNYLSARVIADHVKAATFLISEDLQPGNTGASYVLKRIIRRAAIYLRKMEFSKPLLYSLVQNIARDMCTAYPKLLELTPKIEKIILQEEELFKKTLDFGLGHFDGAAQNAQKSGIIGAPDAFKLYDTYGLPFDLIEDLAKSSSLKIDLEGFNYLMEEQKERARKSWKGANDVQQNTDLIPEILAQHGPTNFIGYTAQNATATLLSAVIIDKEKQIYDLIFDTTAFYAEGGGQIGDTGQIFDQQGHQMANIIDTKKLSGIFIHRAKILKELIINGTYNIVIDIQRRKKIRANHTATHLLYEALHKLYGPHIAQKGSYVGDDYLRFDFNLDRPVAPHEIQSLENYVNDWITLDLTVEISNMKKNDAVEGGATATFDEKYSDIVRVITIKDEAQARISFILCGGTHVPNLGEIRLFKIVTESGIAKGIRRIEAVTGEMALEKLMKQSRLLGEISVIIQKKKVIFQNQFTI